MMMFVKILVLFFSLLPAAFALTPGTCRAIPESKVYLSDHFSLPYPKDVEFSCLYECLGTDQEISHEVRGVSKVRVRHQRDDALKVVCQGVKVKRTSWGYDFDRVDPFYAYVTRMNEIREWADVYVSKDNPLEKEKLKNLREELIEVVQGYEQASRSGAPTADSFARASRFLGGVLEGLPEDANLLDYSIQSVRSERSLIAEDDLADTLVTQVLESLAYWR